MICSCAPIFNFFAIRRQMAPVQSIKFQTANFPIFSTRIIMIFWTTCIAREVFSLVIRGNLTQILPVLQWLKVVIAFVSFFSYNYKPWWHTQTGRNYWPLTHWLCNFLVPVHCGCQHYQQAPSLPFISYGAACDWVFMRPGDLDFWSNWAGVYLDLGGVAQW